MIKKRDLLTIAFLLIISLLGFAGMKLLTPKSKPSAPPTAATDTDQLPEHSPAQVTKVEVSVNGTTVTQLDLNEDQEYTIRGSSGGTNHLVIKDGQAYLDQASCPDQVCIHQGKIPDPVNHIIVCLPNQVVIRIDE